MNKQETKNEKIIEKVREFVDGACRNPNANYGDNGEVYTAHFIPVRDYAVEIAKRLGADEEIVELAALMHDIGSIIEGRENHHISGAEIAEKKLRSLGYPEEKIMRVKHCILAHRGSQEIPKETIEARIVSDADALSNFENIAGIFKAAFVYEGRTQTDAKISTREKLERKWKKLELDESRKIIKPKYEAVMLLLK